MRELPRGTVTFLFTDIEGSTRLLHELGPAEYGSALDAHRRVLRDAFASHGGVEVDTQGDAFFVAFPTAPGALEAAREGQEALDLPVRMGLHTGTPLLTDEGYVGADVHRAARIAAAGHGRQVLVSSSTAALVQDVELRDLGEHRLKDLSAPERIFQLGDCDFPPLKTLYRTNLPVPATLFLGREQELEVIVELLGRGDVRLLTLTGAGGSGKTRLALQAAGAAGVVYPHGVWWVPLAPLTDAAEVLPAVARALGGVSAPEAVADRRMLLVLDNFEHVVEAAIDLATLLVTCPNLDLLVTSRERLRIQGEQLYPVPTLARAEARELFVQRARAARPDFEPDDLVEELCARLDDLPLALELAAARTSLLSTSQLVERLGSRLDFLRGGRDAETRQQTLRSTIEWSYELLGDEERRLLAALSVFRGGWTIESAEGVCHADVELLQSLADKSLIRRWDSRRFGMLETIREFADEQLERNGEAAETRRRHGDYFLELAEKAGLSVEGIESGRGEGGYEAVLPESHNLRAALDFFLGADEIETATRVAVSLEQYWVTNSPAEGARLLGGLRDRGGLPPELRVRVTRSLSGCLYIQGRFDEGAPLLVEALDLYRGLGEAWGIAHMLLRLAIDASRRGEGDEAKRLLNESLALWKSPFNKAQVDLQLAGVLFREGRIEEALELADRSARLSHEIGFVWWEKNARAAAAEFALRAGQSELGREHALPALGLAHSIGDRQGLVFSLALLAWAAADAGDPDRAGRLWGAVETEGQRAPIGQWEGERGDYEARLSPVEGPEFDRAVEAGRRMTLDDAVSYALSA